MLSSGFALNYVEFRARREPYMVQGWPQTTLGSGLALNYVEFRAGEKGPKKIPSLRIEDWGFTRLHPSQSYPRRPLREEYPGRFSDSPDLNSPSHPELAQEQWLFC